MTVMSSDPPRPQAPARRVRPEPKRPVVKPSQCRAARAWLDWTQAKLAHQAGVARKTIADFERGNRALHYRSKATITAALENAGVEFLWPDDVAGEGVTFRMADERAFEPMPPAER